MLNRQKILKSFSANKELLEKRNAEGIEKYRKGDFVLKFSSNTAKKITVKTARKKTISISVIPKKERPRTKRPAAPQRTAEIIIKTIPLFSLFILSSPKVLMLLCSAVRKVFLYAKQHTLRQPHQHLK